MFISQCAKSSVAPVEPVGLPPELTLQCCFDKDHELWVCIESVGDPLQVCGMILMLLLLGHSIQYHGLLLVTDDPALLRSRLLTTKRCHATKIVQRLRLSQKLEAKWLQHGMDEDDDDGGEDEDDRQ